MANINDGNLIINIKFEDGKDYHGVSIEGRMPAADAAAALTQAAQDLIKRASEVMLDSVLELNRTDENVKAAIATTYTILGEELGVLDGDNDKSLEELRELKRDAKENGLSALEKLLLAMDKDEIGSILH